MSTAIKLASFVWFTLLAVLILKGQSKMATRSDLDSALSALLTAEAARDAAVTKALNDLIVKVGSGGVTPEDFTSELQQIATLQNNAAALTQTATTDDPGSTDVTNPPAAS